MGATFPTFAGRRLDMIPPLTQESLHKAERAAQTENSPDRLTLEQVASLRRYQGSFDLKRNPQAVDLLIAE